MKYLKKYNESVENPKILFLTLSKGPFSIMVTGEKTEEFRTSTKWIHSRVNNNKDYDYVKFVNGYGNDKPYFICEYKGFEVLNEDETEDDIREYSNGLSVGPMKRGDVIIYLGDIIKKGNI